MAEQETGSSWSRMFKEKDNSHDVVVYKRDVKVMYLPALNGTWFM